MQVVAVGGALRIPLLPQRSRRQSRFQMSARLRRYRARVGVRPLRLQTFPQSRSHQPLKLKLRKLTKRRPHRSHLRPQRRLPSSDPRRARQRRPRSRAGTYRRLPCRPPLRNRVVLSSRIDRVRVRSFQERRVLAQSRQALRSNRLGP